MKMCSNHIEFKVRINSWGRYRNLTLSMKPTDTINKLKDKLSVTKGVVSLNVGYDLLLCNNKNLFDEDGSSRLFNHWNEGEGDNQIVLCEKGSFHIRVHIPAGCFLIIEVNSLMTLLQFKETLSKLMHGRLDFDLEMFAKYPMILVHRVLDKDEHCLGFYDIVKLPSELPNAQDIIVKFKTRFLRYKVSDAYVPVIVNASRLIITSRKIYVFIKFSESVTFRMMLWVGRGDTVKTVKNMIKERAKVQKDIIALTYIEEGEYMLLFNKQQLSEDDESTLKQCGVGDEGELLLYPRSSFHIRIFLVVYDLPYVDTIPDFQVLVNCMDNVDVVKAHITSHFGVVVDSLWYGKTRLSSERLLLDYDIVDHFVSKVSCWKCSEVRLTGYCVRRL